MYYSHLVLKEKNDTRQKLCFENCQKNESIPRREFRRRRKCYRRVCLGTATLVLPQHPLLCAFITTRFQEGHVVCLVGARHQPRTGVLGGDAAVLAHGAHTGCQRHGAPRAAILRHAVPAGRETVMVTHVLPCLEAGNVVVGEARYFSVLVCAGVASDDVKDCARVLDDSSWRAQ